MAVVSIKGVRNGLLIILDDSSPWEQVVDNLFERLNQRSDFYRGVRVALQVGERDLDHEDIKKLRDRLAKHDLQLASLLGKSAETMRTARREGLDTDLPDTDNSQHDINELPPIDSNEYGTSGVMVKSTLRSGRIVRHVGHVVIIGDVNPGAQIIAGGDVLVWGRLRGTVHAGAAGDEDALVCALDMRPMQLRIANYVAVASDDGRARPRPEIASIRNGQIIAEEWGA